MIGMIAIDAVVSEDIKVRGPPLLRDPLRPALPIPGAGGDVEDDLARLAGGPRLHHLRLLDLQPEAVCPLKVPSGVICAAPVPFRLQGKRDDRFGHMPS